MFSEQGIPIKALIARKGAGQRTVTWVEPKDLARQREDADDLRLSWRPAPSTGFSSTGILGWCAGGGLRRRPGAPAGQPRASCAGPSVPIYGFGMVALLHCRAGGWPRGAGAASARGRCSWRAWPADHPAIELVGGLGAVPALPHPLVGLHRHLPGNLGGYICPQFSLLWGAGQCDHDQDRSPRCWPGAAMRFPSGCCCRWTVCCWSSLRWIWVPRRRLRPG